MRTNAPQSIGLVFFNGANYSIPAAQITDGAQEFKTLAAQFQKIATGASVTIVYDGQTEYAATLFVCANLAGTLLFGDDHDDNPLHVWNGRIRTAYAFKTATPLTAAQLAALTATSKYRWN